MSLFYLSKKVVFVACFFGLFFGCSTSRQNIMMQANKDLASSVLLPEIKAGMLLNINVTVSGIDEIHKEGCNVSQDGYIYLPLLESVDVVGLTIIEVEIKLKALCSQFFVNPQVDVAFSRTRENDFVSPWGYVSVMGNVVKPGRIALPQGRKLKISEAVAMAGGLAPSAKDRSVRLVRQMDDGKYSKEKVNLRSIVAGGKVDQDVELLPGDFIFVPESIF